MLAAIACALNFGLTYYGQVSNLDVPYLFWAVLAEQSAAHGKRLAVTNARILIQCLLICYGLSLIVRAFTKRPATRVDAGV